MDTSSFISRHPELRSACADVLKRLFVKKPATIGAIATSQSLTLQATARPLNAAASAELDFTVLIDTGAQQINTISRRSADLLIAAGAVPKPTNIELSGHEGRVHLHRNRAHFPFPRRQHGHHRQLHRGDLAAMKARHHGATSTALTQTNARRFRLRPQ